MKMFFAVALMALLAGCATSYQPVGFSGGYSETQLGEDIFQVTFKGNGYTSRDRAADLSFLRAAELTLEHGFRYFVIVDADKSSTFSTYTSPSTSYTTGTRHSATTTTQGGQMIFISKPASMNTIRCFKEKPAIDGVVFDAEFVAKSIKDKYKIIK